MPDNKHKKNMGEKVSPNNNEKHKDDISQSAFAADDNTVSEDAGINKRPPLRANIKRHIFSVPKESSSNPNIIIPEAYIDEEKAKVDANANVEDKTRRINLNTASVKRTQINAATNIKHIDPNPKNNDNIEENHTLSEKTRNIIPANEQKLSEDEQTLESELKKARLEVTKGFVLDSQNIPYTRDLPNPPETDIFQISNSNRRLASKHLLRLKKAHLLKTAAISLIGLVLLFLAFLNTDLRDSDFANKYINFVFLNFILVFAAAGIGQSELLDGFKAIKNRSPNYNSFISIMWSGAILQSIVFLSQPSVVGAGLQLCNAAAVILSLPAFIAKYLNIKRALTELLNLTTKDEISVVAKVSNDEMSHEFGKGVINDESCIHFNAKTKSLNNFIDNILKTDPVKNLYKIMFIAFVSISFLLGLILFIKERDIFAAVTALTISLCAIMPSSLTLSLAFLIFLDNIGLSKSRAAILSFEAAESKSKSNSIILNAEDIFPSDFCEVHGIVPYNKMRIDNAIILAATMLIEAGGPLSGLFNNIILDRNDILPEIDSLIYEDKLGLSAWVDNKIVLLGSLEHLKHHNVKLPASDFYKKHCIGDRKPLFLAVEGVLAAMFVVSYYADDGLIDEIKKLTNNGVSLLVNTSDPNISEDFIEKSLGLEQNTVKIMNQKMAELHKSLKNDVSHTIEAGSFHDGTAISFLKTINSSNYIVSKKNISIAASIVFSIISLLLISIFLFTKGGIVKAGSIQIVLFHVFWNALGLIIPKLIAILPRK